MSIKSLPLYWRRIPQRYRLEGTHCLNCNAVYFPARSFCRACRRKGKIEPKALSGE
ncbi:MAG TPA: zinc ribbon domain-containing protein, partial [archaeon]|nr:zinc ribbon domain-containing protein [archaeon]